MSLHPTGPRQTEDALSSELIASGHTKWLDKRKIRPSTPEASSPRTSAAVSRFSLGWAGLGLPTGLTTCCGQPGVGCPGGLVEAPFCCDRSPPFSPSLDVLIQALSPSARTPGTLPWRPVGADDTFLWFGDF